MEYATKSIYGALGEDPLRTEAELTYARDNIFTPIFDWVREANAAAVGAVEEATGLDLDRDGGVGVV